MQFARLNSDRTLRDVIELTQAQYDALAGNPKQALLLPLVIDVQPIPTALQVVVAGSIKIEATQARQTWSLRDKSAAELDAEAQAAEMAKILEILNDIETQRAVTRATWDGYTANQLKAEQWRDRQVLLRLANLLAKQLSTGAR